MKLFRIFVLSMAICGGARAGDSEDMQRVKNIVQSVETCEGWRANEEDLLLLTKMAQARKARIQNTSAQRTYEEQNLLILANLAQVVSFHYGFTRDLHSVDSDRVSRDRFGGIIGASVGWNLFADGELRPKPSIPTPFVG